MDIFMMEAVIREINAEAAGAKIKKIHQPAADVLVVRLWTGRSELHLLISASAQFGRLYFTEKSFSNPYTPPRFCQLLRARLSGLEKAELVAWDRIAVLRFHGKDGRSYRLMVELLARHANLVLVDEQNRIVDALRRVGEEETGRAIQPGALYRLPASPGKFRLDEDLPSLADMPEGGDCSNWLQKHFSPMTSLMARDLAEGVRRGQGADLVLDAFRSRWLEKGFFPSIVETDGREYLSAFRPSYLTLEGCSSFYSPSEAAEQFYSRKVEETGGEGLCQELTRVVKKAIKRLEARLVNIEKEQARQPDTEKQKQLGELLLANLHQIKKGMTEVTLEDYYSEPPQPVTIELDPKLSPQENAQRYFKGFKKGKRGVSHVERRLSETRQEKSWLEEVLLALEEAEAARDFEVVRDELVQQRVLPASDHAKRGGQSISIEESLRTAVTPGGFRLFWGKNSRTNEYVSRVKTAAEDLWFHAHGMPGCHLVLKRETKGAEVPETDVLFAAALAGGYSRGKNDSKVEVMVTEGKWVRRPKGAPPGLVTVDRYRTVLVSPARQEADKSTP